MKKMLKKKPANLKTNGTRLVVFALSVVLALIGLGHIFNNSSLSAVRIIDGDTIELPNGKRLRLLGIDTPETRKFINGAWIEINEPFSKEAKLFTKNFCKGKKLRIEYDVNKLDKYHRLLGYCFAGGKMLNEELLSHGLAHLFFMEPNNKYANRLQKAHFYAIKHKTGLWQDKNSIIKAEDMRLYKGKVKIVCGNIKKVIFSNTECLLLFDKEFKNHINIPSSIAFGHGEYIRSLEGTDICVEGKIKERSGRHFVRIFHMVNLFPPKKLR